MVIIHNMQLAFSPYTVEKVITVKKFIDQNEADNVIALKNNYLAKQFHISLSLLEKVFALKYNISLRKYIILIRFSRAQFYLAELRLPPSEVSKRLGYSIYNNFSRDFKKYVGISPVAYIKQVCL